MITKKDIYIFFAILVLLGMAVYIGYLILSNGGKCVNDPLVYSAKALETKNNASVECTCTIYGKVPSYIDFNKKGSIIRAKEQINISWNN